MSVELFNACAYLVDRQVEAGLGGRLAVTGPAGSLSYAERPGTSGTVVPGYEARLVDDAGGPVPDGEPGHLLVPHGGHPRGVPG